MVRFLLARLAVLIPTFIGITFIAFVLIRLVPGDPIDCNRRAGADTGAHAQLSAQFGFDRPLVLQYAYFLGGLLQGDLGRSRWSRASRSSPVPEPVPGDGRLSVIGMQSRLSWACRPRSWPRSSAARHSTTR